MSHGRPDGCGSEGQREVEDAAMSWRGQAIVVGGAPHPLHMVG